MGPATKCPTCGRYYQLTNYGRIRRHMRSDRRTCPGSGSERPQEVVRDAVVTETYKLHTINYAQFLNELKELHSGKPGRTLSRVQWVDSLIAWAEGTDRDARTMNWEELERTREEESGGLDNDS